MTERELRNLSRSDLLELLIHQSKQVQILQDKLTQAQAALESRQITINQAGSIADAALQLNGVFEAAQAASQQYMDNIKQLSDRQASVCAQLEEESREKAEQYLAKARKNELLDPYKLDKEYTDKEVFQLITLPGFSTKEAVTEYSGRGVGMDVVVSNLQAIGGSLEIESVLGQGSQMIMKIPLTLAIIDGIVMKVGKSAFVLETNLVKEFMRAQQDMLVMKPDGQELVMVRGECYPVLRVGEWYQLSDYKLNMEKAMFVLVEIEEQVICLIVDDLVGKQEIVVKPIPDYVKKVKGLSGCTQLGDGSIALILDVGALTK